MEQEPIMDFSDDGAGLVVGSSSFSEEVRDELIDVFESAWNDAITPPQLPDVCVRMAATIKALLEMQGLDPDRTVFEVEDTDDDGPVTEIVVGKLLEQAEAAFEKFCDEEDAEPPPLLVPDSLDVEALRAEMLASGHGGLIIPMPRDDAWTKLEAAAKAADAAPHVLRIEADAKGVTVIGERWLGRNRYEIGHTNPWVELASQADGLNVTTLAVDSVSRALEAVEP